MTSWRPVMGNRAQMKNKWKFFLLWSIYTNVTWSDFWVWIKLNTRGFSDIISRLNILLNNHWGWRYRWMKCFRKTHKLYTTLKKTTGLFYSSWAQAHVWPDVFQNLHKHCSPAEHYSFIINRDTTTLIIMHTHQCIRSVYMSLVLRHNTFLFLSNLMNVIWQKTLQAIQWKLDYIHFGDKISCLKTKVHLCCWRTHEVGYM